ncbi:MAG: L-glutamate gamma-semialdehyde dehydrogenase [Acaryochloridaceae cyanobacterium CSU_3_4]|nr:L-glutamate gamma-semialdehyde dehydrogenase [Acaryochloris sp. SU_5_25]NJN37740.1 L-glutamate gamma-semialdehyde dehydrogenase [Acaryochloridaceae cyanobacterium CSU_3_4]
MQGERSWLGQVLEPIRLDNKLLAWSMSDPNLRVQLFRLIDVLPILSNPADVASHLQEYLTAVDLELPVVLKQLLKFATPNSLRGDIAARVFKASVSALAHQYIAGETFPQLSKVIAKLRSQGMAFSVDCLGEAVLSETEAASYRQGYLDLITHLSGALPAGSSAQTIKARDGQSMPWAQISVKLTAFYSQFDPLDRQGSQHRVLDHLRLLLQQAQALGVGVHFDMEQHVYKDLTLTILKDLLMEPEFRNRTDIGLTLQAYLRSSYQDLQDLLDWVRSRGTPLTIRLVKGAYWDQETILACQQGWPQPVFAHKGETDANFERMTELLLKHHPIVYAAIASHNVRSQAKAMAIAHTLQIPPERFEIQVLYGMADRLAQALVHQGYRVRVYCPYGPLIPGMAYLIRRLLENTANTSFLRQSLEMTDTKALLAPPSQSPVTLATPPIDPNHTADTNYAEATARQQAAQARESVRRQLGKSYWPWIDGQSVTTSTVQNSINPCQPTEIIGQVGLATVALAEQSLQAAQAALLSWQNRPVSERSAILRRAADLMAAQRQELSYWMVLEVGKVLREADIEVSEAIDYCRYYAAEMERLEQGHTWMLPGETNIYRYQSRGIAIVIPPWNFPLAIPTGMSVAALVTGNCVILKPAAPAMVIAAKLTEILVAAGVPSGVFQYLPGRGSEIGTSLVQHPAVHLIAFTGSRAVGCQIYADAAQVRPGQLHLKRVIAEMGGKNAIIIDRSADLDQAVAGVVQSAFGYSGQKCSACSRVIVLETIYEAFLQRLIAATESLQIGPAEALGTQVGSVITAAAQKRIRQAIAQAKTEAAVALEMEAPDSGYYVGPVIFKDVSPQSQIAQEEIFGPVLAVIRTQTFEQGIAIANATPYALTGGLYSRTPSQIKSAKATFKVGNLYINRSITGAIVGRQPFGGFKLSGIGSKAGGPDYLLQFLEPMVITDNLQRQGFAPLVGNQ